MPSSSSSAYVMDTPINTLDGRVMDPVHCGQYPQMGYFQPSVTHRDFSIGPFLCKCPSSSGMTVCDGRTKNLESYCSKPSGHWQDKGYLPWYLYGPYGDDGRSCERWLTTYRTQFPEKFELKAYPLNDIHVQPALHCFVTKPFF